MSTDALKKVCDEVRDGLLEEIANAAFGLDNCLFDTPEAEEAHEALQFAVWSLLRTTDSSSQWFDPRKFTIAEDLNCDACCDAD